MTDNPPEPGKSPDYSALLIFYGTDIITVLLTVTLLVLPIENGIYWPFAFIALVPLLLRAWTRSYWSIFLLSFFSFFLYQWYILQWLIVYGEHWRMLLAFMNAPIQGFVVVLAFYLMRRYRAHFFATLLATVFVLLEFKQTIGFFGFPWPLLSHSQCLNLPFIQIAAVTGCWGITFLIVHVNETLAHLIADRFKSRILPIAILPVILIGISGVYGAFSLAGDNPEPSATVTIVQRSEATNREWTENYNIRAIDEYTQQTVDELTPEPASQDLVGQFNGPRLVIWPETSISDAVKNHNQLAQIQSLAYRFDATFLVGCLTWDPADGIPYDIDNYYGLRDEYGEYNSLVAFLPDSSVIPLHSKIRVVPFGEVIPMKEIITGLFPGYYWGSSDIDPGEGFYTVDTPAGRVGAIICYESFFPQINRWAMEGGADVLVLVSNTSWYERTRASYQHAAFDVFRAVENNTWFCRAATTGISSVIDPKGKVVMETELFKAEAMTVPIGKRSGTTLYARWGDWMPTLAGVYLLVLLIGVFLIRSDH